MTEVNRLQDLLRSVASKMENGAGELTKDMLLEVADKIGALDVVAVRAAQLIAPTPRNGDGSKSSKVDRAVLGDLVDDLNSAGRYGQGGTYIQRRR
jgi:hypothetical protein